MKFIKNIYNKCYNFYLKLNQKALWFGYYNREKIKKNFSFGFYAFHTILIQLFIMYILFVVVLENKHLSALRYVCFIDICLRYLSLIEIKYNSIYK